MENKSFRIILSQLRRLIPAGSFAILAFTYIIAFLVTGIFLGRSLAPTLGVFLGYSLGMSVGVAGQVVRGTIVYFDQMSPNRPRLSLWLPKVVALSFAVFASVEIWKLGALAGIPVPALISFVGLMLAGALVELKILAEVDYSTNKDLHAQRELWQEHGEYIKAREELREYLLSLTMDHAPMIRHLGGSQRNDPKSPKSEFVEIDDKYLLMYQGFMRDNPDADAEEILKMVKHLSRHNIPIGKAREVLYDSLVKPIELPPMNGHAGN